MSGNAGARPADRRLRVRYAPSPGGLGPGHRLHPPPRSRARWRRPPGGWRETSQKSCGPGVPIWPPQVCLCCCLCQGLPTPTCLVTPGIFGFPFLPRKQRRSGLSKVMQLGREELRLKTRSPQLQTNGVRLRFCPLPADSLCDLGPVIRPSCASVPRQ